MSEQETTTPQEGQNQQGELAPNAAESSNSAAGSQPSENPATTVGDAAEGGEAGESSTDQQIAEPEDGATKTPQTTETAECSKGITSNLLSVARAGYWVKIELPKKGAETYAQEFDLTKVQRVCYTRTNGKITLLEVVTPEFLSGPVAYIEGIGIEHFLKAWEVYRGELQYEAPEETPGIIESAKSMPGQVVLNN